jgi:hypothetical protein
MVWAICAAYAYGANIGWINFDEHRRTKINMITGQMSGYVWSANCGWISLSNAVAYVQTDTISPGALAPDGLPIAWLLTYFGTTNVNANADPTGKGMTIAQDYLAGTDPNNVNSILRITAGSFSSGGTSAALTWNSVPTRYYYILKTPSLRITCLDGQRLGTHFPLRRFDHRGQLHRYQSGRTVLPRRSNSSAHAINFSKEHPAFDLDSADLMVPMPF